ncbi:MAG: sodium:solute symporter family protein [Planctomycetota bacterium]
MTRFHLLDWLAIGGYLVFALGVGIYLTKRASRSTGDFYLAGRSLPWWVAGTSLVATSFAADTPLVVSGWVRSDGISMNWIWWGMAVGGSLTFVCLAAWWRRLEVTTDAEAIEIRYSGRAAKFLRGFYGGYHALITNTVILAWVLLAMLKLVRVVLDLDDDSLDHWIVGVALVLALSYSFLSGLWGVVMTDFFQFFLALFGALLLAWKSIDALGGLEAARESFRQLGPATTSILPTAVDEETGAALPWTALAYWTQGFGAFFVFTAVQGWLNKNADGGGAGVQRYSACRTESHARGAALWFHLAHYCLRPWPWIVVGLASMILISTGELSMLESGPDYEEAYPRMMAMLLGPGLFGLLCASFLAAFMSTLDTHFNLGSAYLVNDLYRRFLNRKAKPTHYVWVGRFAEIGIGLLAALFALSADSISNLFTFSLSLLGGVGPALLLRWFWWRANPWTELSALLTSTLLTLLLNSTMFGTATDLVDIPYPLSYLLVIGLSLVVCLVTTLLTPPVEREHLRAFHDKVQPAGAWKPYGTGAVGRLRPILVGWAGGIALIYGLLFGIGGWLLGDPILLPFTTALVGAGLLRWSWPRSVADEIEPKSVE